MRLSLTEAASYGYVNFSSLQFAQPGVTTGAAGNGAPAGGTTGGTTPGGTSGGAVGGARPVTQAQLPPTTLLTESSYTTLNAIILLSRRLTLRLSPSYQLSGGADTTARLTMPLTYGPRFEAALDYGATRLDHFITGAAFSRRTILDAPIPGQAVIPGATATARGDYHYTFIEPAEEWMHHWSRLTDTTFGIGVTFVRSTLPNATQSSTENNKYLTAEATIHYQLPYRDRLDLQLTTRLQPVVNVLTGLLAEEVEGVGIGSYRRGKWGVAAETHYAKSIHPSDPGALTVVVGDVHGSYRPSFAVELLAGVRASWQKAGQGDPNVQKLAFVAVTLRERTLHF